MTGICGLLGDGGYNLLSSKLKEIETVISHRGKEHNQFFLGEGLREIHSHSKQPRDASYIIGVSALGRGNCKPCLESNSERTILLDNNLPQTISRQMLKGISADFEKMGSGGSPSLLEVLFGSVVLYINKKGVWLFRSVDGTKPVFYGKDNDTVAFSTERKGLWNAGITKCRRVEPGYALKIDWNGNATHSIIINRYRNLNLHGCFKSEIVSQLETSLNEAFERLRSQNCAVLFSGGIDSSLAALMAERVANDVILITAKAEGSHDETAAVKAARRLGINHLEIGIDKDTVWHILPRIIYSIESTNKMDVEIAIPFFLSTLRAAERGYEIIVSGQGPDELFAGYHRYLEAYNPENPKELNQEMKSDIYSTYRRNIERDELAIANAGGKAFFPYLFTNFVELGIATPLNYKISLGDEPSRKRIFQELALSMGLPRDLVSVPKKATQYSSGASDVLIEAIRDNVPDLSEFGKSRVSRRVQDVLDHIGIRIGIPLKKEKRFDLRINTDAMDAFLQEINSEK